MQESYEVWTFSSKNVQERREVFEEKVLTYFAGGYRSNLFKAVWGDNLDESVLFTLYTAMEISP
jgi:hypothetical protein